MPLTKPNEKLRRNLKEAAATLKWAGVDLFDVAKRMLATGDEQGANDLMNIALSFQEEEDKLAMYTEEVRAGHLQRKGESRGVK
ncbi:hypothetical protein [Pseudomonas palleroniana]|uniref:hypothetical protein n=1 Tax=Pseudomonas palleroniana TaxID=191390 RepID=UPI0018E6C1C5|nr:hypothetical protein [Pseudomonas palleroniana]MBI6909966.1 hypothetical protein [Pseudomonas palleroniana]